VSLSVRAHCLLSVFSLLVAAVAMQSGVFTVTSLAVRF